ncbi:MAG TPA: hypothetical protein VMZ71_08900, partial [Gemmataceae bacterium]|nr:hypothetical protein [Gemmataceae bacterium]
MGKKSIDSSLLTRAWVHSHEEDTATTRVYRPAGYAFPPTRGRTGFQLQPDGVLSTHKPGPTDQTATAEGTWELADDQLSLNPKGGKAQVLAVESV